MRELGLEALLADDNRCRELLNERCRAAHMLQGPFQIKRLREIELLMSALAAGVVAELLAEEMIAPPDASQAHMAQAQRLCKQGKYEIDEANWTVKAWMMALRSRLRVNPRDGAELVWVPAGKFLMGGAGKDEYTYDNQKPQHPVYLDGYCIYKYVVTVAQYRKFCRASGHRMPDLQYDKFQDNHPMIRVGWEDASAYAAWAGAALPTEAEWEKAARGTDGRFFPWGNEWMRRNAAPCACRRSAASRPMPARMAVWIWRGT